MHDPHDTIVAIASPPGAASRGIIRISGPRALHSVAPLWHADAEESQSLDALRQATRLTGNVSADGFTTAVPCSLFVWPTARSYTRQPSVEIHTVGSAPILQAILKTLCRAGARLAAPGEFTLRAFLAGRLDLTQAEGVLGLIESRDRHELDVAVAQLAGGLGTPFVHLREELLELLAHLEAGLDFVEEDIEFIARDELRAKIVAAASQLKNLEERMAARGVLRDAVRVVLVGQPNVGKSSLFNALLKRSAALVSPVAGTTRDYLVGALTLDGTTIELVDTAGVTGMAASGAARTTAPASCEPGQDIDAAAQQATSQARREATIELVCLDASRPLDAWERGQLAAPGARIVVLTKCDLWKATSHVDRAIATSSTTGQGLDELCQHLRTCVIERAGGDTADVVAVTAARCHDSVRRAATALAQAVKLVDDRAGDELIAAEMRTAIGELGQVVGAVYTDDLLDRIFSRFCIGK
ncbi:MAG TPA: tRNA modification GTPase [Pirellulales bacterium]|nr:tRNA modification GTPase [Pirellulales bacterium]